MKIPESERLAVKQALEAGANFGYGNIIAHLQTAWARRLMKNGLPNEKDAREATGGTGYPFAMQDDLLNSGEWDVTGEKYRKRANAASPHNGVSDAEGGGK